MTEKRRKKPPSILNVDYWNDPKVMEQYIGVIHEQADKVDAMLEHFDNLARGGEDDDKQN